MFHDGSTASLRAKEKKSSEKVKAEKTIKFNALTLLIIVGGKWLLVLAAGGWTPT